MLRLLNILAVMVGVVGGLVGVVGVGVVVMGIVALLRKNPTFLADPMGVYGLGLFGGISFLGFLIASRARRHLRHPDATTVRDMIGTAIYLIAMAGVVPLLKGTFLSPVIILGLYLFHRALVKRITARGFSPDAAAPISTSAT